MLLIHSFFEQVGKVLFGSARKSSKKQTRTLRIEELEPKEMLSATPWEANWDWWESATVTHTLPTGYNLDPASEDFGAISVGGNNSQIDATAAFLPTITGDFLAFDTVTRGSSITEQDGNETVTLGSYTETFIVGITSQDLGGGNWFYQEQVEYTYTYTAAEGEYTYKDGYSYTLTTSFTSGIYVSSFTLTTGYEFKDGFVIGTDPDDPEAEEEESDEPKFYWTLTVDSSVTDTVTITHYHDTLTSQRSSTDTRTNFAEHTYDEFWSFSYDTEDYTYKETFKLYEKSITDMFTTIALVDTGSEWVMDSGSGKDYFFDLYDYKDTYLEDFTEDDFIYHVHDDNWSNSSSKTNIKYLWDSGGGGGVGAWTITTSDATTISGFGYDWEERLSTPHATGKFFFLEKSDHDEESTVKWVYNTTAAMWIATSVTGKGEGSYTYEYKWDTETPYARAFYGGFITGTDKAYIDHRIDEDWEVSFRIVNGVAVREIEGSYTDTYKTGSSFEGGGSHSESLTTTAPGTQYINYRYYDGTVTTHFEREATLRESGSQSYKETITGEWSNKADDQGQLVWSESADAEIKMTADGFYRTYLYEYSFSEFDGSYDHSGCGYSSYGTYYSYSESERTNDLTEEYDAELTEHWSNDGGGFYLQSFDGTASGCGTYDAPSSSYSLTERRDDWSYGCGDGCASYSFERIESSSDGFREIGYDYTADWSWDSDGASATVKNRVTGDVGGTTTHSWNYDWGNGCDSGSGCGYSIVSDSSCNHSSYDYDETIPRTGWYDGNEIGNPFAVRWSPFYGSVTESSGCNDGSASFAAPNFSVSLVLDAEEGNCFTAGTQIVVGAVYDENDVFVQYVTKNIEDIKVGDFVYSYDTITGEVSLREVTATFVREVDHINYLTIVDEYGNTQVIETTDSHPFWVVTDEPDLERAARGTVDENGVILYHENIDPGLNGFWVEAKDLREGDVFLGANGELLTLISQERVEFEESITVYNFTVDGNHNYFVIAAEDVYGQTCVLVHNAEGYDDPPKRTWAQWRQGWWDWSSHMWGVVAPRIALPAQVLPAVPLIKQHMDDRKKLQERYEEAIRPPYEGPTRTFGDHRP